MSSDGSATDTSTWPVNFGNVSVLDPATQSSLNSLVPDLLNGNSPLYTSNPNLGTFPVAPVTSGVSSFFTSGAAGSTGMFLLVGAIALGALLLTGSSKRK